MQLAKRAQENFLHQILNRIRLARELTTPRGDAQAMTAEQLAEQFIYRMSIDCVTK
jgi:hypothetical protein